jgi:hypothetical protein
MLDQVGTSNSLLVSTRFPGSASHRVILFHAYRVLTRTERGGVSGYRQPTGLQPERRNACAAPFRAVLSPAPQHRFARQLSRARYNSLAVTSSYCRYRASVLGTSCYRLNTLRVMMHTGSGWVDICCTFWCQLVHHGCRLHTWYMPSDSPTCSLRLHGMFGISYWHTQPRAYRLQHAAVVSRSWEARDTGQRQHATTALLSGCQRPESG